MPRILPLVSLVLSIASLFVAGVASAADLPRAPQEGLSYLERAFLPEPVPAAEELSGMAAAKGDPAGVESDPNSYLSGSSFTWTSMSPPDGRSTHTAVYDPFQDRVVVFGGRRQDGGTALFNDCWEFRSSLSPKWSSLEAGGDLPTGRAGPTAIFDPVANRMLMWGGDDFTSDTPPFREVWALNLSPTPTWTQLSVSGTPPLATFCARAVYDAPARRILMYGGVYEGNVVSEDLWELRLSPTAAWQKLTPLGSGPGPRYWHTAVYDESRRRMLVYGGTDGTTPFGDVWSLAITDTALTWEQLSTDGTPPTARYTHMAVYDPDRDCVVITAGVSTTAYLNDSWILELSPTPRWVQLMPTNETLLPRTSPAGVYLPNRHSMLLFGGYVTPGWPDMYINDTWELMLTPGAERWEVAFDSNEPDPYWLGRHGHSAILDAISNRMIIFGGAGTGGERNDTWALSLSSLDGPPNWTQIETQGTLPLSRQGQAMIWDDVGHRLIVFSGARDGVMAPFADTWQLDFNLSPPKWSKLTFAGATPPARWWHAGVFHPTRRWMIVFGGDTKTQFLNDLWILDLNGSPAWTQLTPSGVLPGARRMPTLVLDERSDRVILFGGDATSGRDYNDVWTLGLSNPTHWNLLLAGGSSLSLPDGRFFHVATYDSLNERMLVYGSCTTLGTDLWSFSDQGVPPQWSRLTVPAGPPTPFCGRSAVLDPSRGTWILYGGAWSADSNNLWRLRWDVPVPVQVTYANIRCEDDLVILEWRSSEPKPGTFYVDRELPGQPRERVSEAIIPVGPTYSFRDASTPPVGTRYYLELLDRAGGTTSFGPYELLDAPGVLGVAPMLTATPNPFHSGVKLTARGLPAGDLLIEVCSVAGRVVYREPTLVGFGGGNAEFQPSGISALPSGMYFVRVRVGSAVVSSRLVKLP